MHHLTSLGMLLGRILIGGLFAMAGLGKFLDPDGTAAFMAAKGMTFISFFLYAAAILELFAGLALIFGIKTRWAALLLALFLIPTTLIFHDYWHDEGPAQMINMIMFSKNMAILGGLLYVMSTGAGKYALERLCGDSCCDKECDVKNHK